MLKPYEAKPGWTSCRFCEKIDFPNVNSFVAHLREKHCTKEGGSFVCHYGENQVCCTLPVEGVSDFDYERHVYKAHAVSMAYSRKSSTGSISGDKDPDKWTFYSAAQNLPAVLNDPSKGKQKDLFTKTWGDSFVDHGEIPDPHYLPHIDLGDFEHYLRRIGKKHKRHVRINALAPKPDTHADLLQNFPSLRVGKQTERSKFDISAIPKIFLHPTFDLSNKETFDAIYSHTLPSTSNQTSQELSANNSAKLLQEKLTHYLDLIEVQIAQQVAEKSEAFFHAMTSHDVLMEQLGHTISIVRTLREKINKIDNDLVKDSLNIIKIKRTRENYLQVYRKLKVMSNVMQAQPTIRLLLSSPDYIGALDLIQTSQDLLKQELAGIHSFRHLSSELSELLKFIETLMAEEFERCSTADLNRPFVDGEPEVLEEEKLSCIVMGMLRQGSTSFVETYNNECIAAVKAAVKQAVIEVVSNCETNADLSLDEQLKSLPVEKWTFLLNNTTSALLRLLKRIKCGTDIMLRAADISAGKHGRETEDMIVPESTDWQLSSEDHGQVCQKIRKLLISICEYSQDRSAHLLLRRSLMWPEDKSKDEIKSRSSHWLAERASLAQLRELASQVDLIVKGCEEICPEASTLAIRSAFSHQASKFMARFHADRSNKLFLLLDGEPWRQIEVPATFQQLVDHIAENGTFAVSKEDTDSIKNSLKTKLDSVLYVDNQKYAVVGTVLILVNIVAEYCVHAEDMSLSSEALLRHLSELLTQFNSRCYKLVLGGEAVSEKTGLKRITSTNLALLLRALQLLLWLLPHVKLHFQSLIGESPRNYLDQVSQNVKDHARDIQTKLVDIVNNLITAELKQWEAKPPVPSKSFQNICKHLIKFSEAVANILPQDQVQELYLAVNQKFKETFREKLQRMNIINNGGPQHGLVITELTFYLEDLKKATSLPPESLELSTMDDLWSMKASSR